MPRRTTASFTVVSVWLNHGALAATSFGISTTRSIPYLTSSLFRNFVGNRSCTAVLPWSLVNCGLRVRHGTSHGKVGFDAMHRTPGSRRAPTGVDTEADERASVRVAGSSCTFRWRQ